MRFDRIRRGLGLAGVLLVWEIGARLEASPMLVPPTAIIPALWGMVQTGGLARHALVSLRHIAVGFSLAALIGTALGVVVAEFDWADAVLMPVVDTIRPVSALTLFPLLILLFGLGLWSKVTVIFWTAWPAILLNTVQGIRKVDREVVEAAQIDGATKGEVLRYIRLPLALPTVMTGFRIGMSGGWISLVAAEMLGSSAGLGYATLAFSQTFRFPEMYGIIITIATIGLAMNVVMNWIQTYLDRKERTDETPFFPPGLRIYAVAGLADRVRGNGDR